MARPDGRIEAGQSLKTAISATAWNRAQDAADIVLGARGGVQGEPQQNGLTPYNWCFAKNNSGNDVPRWGVLKISGLAISPNSSPGGVTAEFEKMPVLSGVEPVEGDTLWCVAVEPIADGKVGKVAVAGVVQVKVFVTNQDDEFVGTTSSTEELRTGSDGQGVILWKESGAGSGKWALVRIGASVGSSPIKLARTNSDWAKSTSQDVQVYGGGTQSAFNGFAQVGALKWVMIAKPENYGGEWYLIAAEC